LTVCAGTVAAGLVCANTDVPKIAAAAAAMQLMM
jgi:hypothetical protein